MPVPATETPISADYDENLAAVKEILGYGQSFDVIIKEIDLGRRRAFLVAIDGFAKDDILLRIVDFMLLRARQAHPAAGDLEELLRQQVGYIETGSEEILEKVIDKVLSGVIALFVEGETKVALIDARTYPVRSIDEPDLEKVLRGPKDGFTETIVFNTALIRRRVRDPKLRVELKQVGHRSKTDVALLYIEDIANPRLVRLIKKRLDEINIDGLPMAEKSLEEFLIGRRAWWNPFPVTRFTERPDTAAVHLLEGHLVIIVDTTPVALVLPTTFFHHMEHAEEFHEDPTVGLFVRLVRYGGLFLAWFGIPLWVALALDREMLPDWLSFIGPKENTAIPLFLQFILGEFGIELIRIALVHTPTALATSLGLIGAVLLGQMAVEVGLFVSETVLYVTLGALGSFSLPSFELASAIRIMRILLLILAGVWGVIGVLIGFAFNIILLFTTRSYGVPYLWPLIPLDLQGLKHVVLRHPWPALERRPQLVDPRDPDRQ